MVFRPCVFPPQTTLTFKDLVRLINHAEAVMINGNIATTVESDMEFGVYLEYLDNDTQLVRSTIWHKDDVLNIWAMPSHNTIKVSDGSSEEPDEIKLLVFMKL